MLSPEEATSQEGILEEINERNSERIELQVQENIPQNIPSSELAKVEKWMNQIVWLNCAGFSLIVLADISFFLSALGIPLFWPLGISSISLGTFMFYLPWRKFKKIKKWEKQLTDKNLKLSAISSRLSGNRKLITFFGWFEWIFIFFSGGGALLAVWLNSSLAVALLSFYGLVGERSINKAKEVYQSKQKSLRKEKKKLLKELEELSEDNNSAKEVNSEVNNNQQEITDNNQQYKAYQLQEIIPSGSKSVLKIT